MATKVKQNNEPIKDRKIAYKIRMVIDIEGSVLGQPPLEEDTGVTPFIQWAVDDIEEKLDALCKIVGVKAVELREVGDA